MIDYTAIAEAALAAIREAGTNLLGKRPVVTHDPVTEVTATLYSPEGTFAGVVLPAKRNPYTVSSNDADIENLRAGKVRRLLLAASGAPFVPAPNDIFEFESAVWTVSGCTPLSPAGTPLVYTLEVIKA